MKISISFCSLVAIGLATPAPSQLQAKRAAAPAYAAHTIDQPVCAWRLSRDRARLTAGRSTTSKTLVAMSPIHKTHSSSATSSTHRTTSREDLSSCTSAEKQAERAVSRILRLVVSARIPSLRSTGLSLAVIQILMERFNGLGVILENRYYGKSYPCNTSTTDELRFLTTEQSE